MHCTEHGGFCPVGYAQSLLSKNKILNISIEDCRNCRTFPILNTIFFKATVGNRTGIRMMHLAATKDKKEATWEKFERHLTPSGIDFTRRIFQRSLSDLKTNYQPIEDMLLDPSIQSSKLIAVWTQIEPLPMIVSNPAPIIIGLVLFGIGHAFIYKWLAPAWPPKIKARTWRLAVLIFSLSFLFWEFFTPFNQFSEPVLLIGLELIFWAIIAIVESFVIATVSEW